MAAVRLDSNSFTQLITADHIDHVTKAAASCLLLPGFGIRHFQKSDAPTLGYPRLQLIADCQQLLAKKKGNRFKRFTKILPIMAYKKFT
jgi:hypothetical protein